MSNLGPTSAVGAPEAPQAGPDPGPTAAARDRAIALAKVQATDGEILAVLRVEFSAVRPAKIRTSELVKRMRDWQPWLEDARVAGRLLPLEALRDAAAGGDVAAATALHRRQELLEGLDPELLRQIKRWMALEPSAAVAEVEKLLSTLRAAG